MEKINLTIKCRGYEHYLTIKEILNNLQDVEVLDGSRIVK